MNNYPTQSSYFNSPPVATREVMTVDVITGGDAAAYNYYVAPSVTAVLLDFGNGMMYIKAADQRGIPQPMRMYSIQERVQQQPQPQQQVSAENNLQAQIDELKQMILGLTNQNKGKPKNQYTNIKGEQG